MRTLTAEVCQYRYDALDLLTGLEHAGHAGLQRFYRHQHLVTELQGQASQSVFQQGKQLLAVQLCEGDRLKSQLLATDQQRSVLQLIDSEGALPQAYSPYGHHAAESGLSSLLGFGGERRDPVTGYYLLGNGHRAFNPVLMRFNSPDRLSPFGRGGLNPYAYCLGDPVNFSDPTGGFARLITSLISVANATIVMSPAIPFKLAKDALQRGAAGQLKGRYTLGAAGSTLASVSALVTSLAGVGGAVALITGDTDTAKTLGTIMLGLGALTLVSRMGSYWAARDPKTIPALKRFVDGPERPVAMPSPVSEGGPASPRPSAPPLSLLPQTPGSPQASAPFPTPGPIGFEPFNFPGNNGAVNFLNKQIDRQVGVSRNAKSLRRYSI